MGLKIKNFHASKDTVKRVKMQFIEWKQLFINHISDKGLEYIVQRTHTTQQQKDKQPSLKMGKGLN